MQYNEHVINLTWPSRTGEYRPKVVFVRTSMRSPSSTAMIFGHYSSRGYLFPHCLSRYDNLYLFYFAQDTPWDYFTSSHDLTETRMSLSNFKTSKNVSVQILKLVSIDPILLSNFYICLPDFSVQQ